MTTGNLFSQCLCSEIKFRLVLPGLELKNDSTNYSLKTVAVPHFILDDSERKFGTAEINDDTVSFQFRTGGGIDTLTFVIKDLTNNIEMFVTVLNMAYDNPYFIDLTTFSPGHFFFDWRIINKCQKENLTSELVECEGLKLYQLQLVNKKDLYWPKGFVHNKIRAVNLQFFEKTN